MAKDLKYWQDEYNRMVDLSKKQKGELAKQIRLNTELEKKIDKKQITKHNHKWQFCKEKKDFIAHSDILGGTEYLSVPLHYVFVCECGARKEVEARDVK